MSYFTWIIDQKSKNKQLEKMKKVKGMDGKVSLANVLSNQSVETQE